MHPQFIQILSVVVLTEYICNTSQVGWDCPLVITAGRKAQVQEGFPDLLTSVSSRHGARRYSQHLEEHLQPYKSDQRCPSAMWYLLLSKYVFGSLLNLK